MEFSAGSLLYDHLLENRKYDEDTTKSLIKSILKGLSYIHSKGIIHRDIKLCNIMLQSDDDLKIIDFGLS